MDTNEKTAGSNLTPIAEYSETAAALGELRQRHQGVVYDVTKPKEMKAAKEARAELRTLRTGLEKKRVEIKAPALERCRLIDAEAKRITAELVALEEPIDVQIKAEEARAEAERLAKLEAERLRVEAIQTKIQAIRDVPGSLVGKPSVVIAGQLANLQKTVLDEDEFGEHFLAARDALDAAISRVNLLHIDQVAHEAEQARIKAEREELERVRAENERLQREAEERRQADEERERAARVEQERKEREAREAEDRRIATIRQKINTAAQGAEDLDGRSAQFIAQRKSRFEAFLQENAGFDFLEFADDWQSTTDATLTGIETYLTAAKEAERIEAERREEEERRLQAERDRQDAEQKKLDEQAAQLKRDQQAATAKAEADRLANLGLSEAAQAVVDCYFGMDESSVRDELLDQLIGDLRVALANDAEQAKPARTKRSAAA